MSTGMIEVFVSVLIPVAWMGAYFWMGDRTEARERSANADPQQVKILLDRAYRPSRVAVKTGRPIRLLVTNILDEEPCWDYLDFPYVRAAFELPAGETVAVDLPSLDPGEYTFFSGLGGQRGTLEVLD
jgi:plastocyanin domain-containing protein